jgi:hypothetical protein
MVIENQDDLENLLEQLGSNKLLCSITLKGEQNIVNGRSDTGEE